MNAASTAKSRPLRFLDTRTASRIAELAATRATSDETLTYAVGDVHGQASKLLALLEMIGADAKAREAAWRIVFLGDYVDRGPDPAKAIAIIRLLQDLAPADAVVCLKGNHEEMMLRSGTHPDDWNCEWGLPTLRSFGATTRRTDDIPKDVLDWARGLPTSHEDRLRIFVHAGLKAGAPLSRQTDLVKLWMREGFADCDHEFEKHVVHGHTPTAGEPDRRRFRTNLDTGAGMGRNLTAGVFDDGSAAPIAFLSA